MILIFRDLRRYFVKAHLLGASCISILSLAGCSPAGKNIAKDLYVVESPSGLESVALLRNGVFIPKIPPLVISVLESDSNILITQQDYSIVLRNNIASIEHKNNFKYYLVQKNTNNITLIDKDKFLYLVTQAKNIKNIH